MQFSVALIFSSFIWVVFAGDCDPGTCSEGETCCPTGNPEEYRCCPYVDATCCLDHTSCCPKDSECDVKEGYCLPKMMDEQLLEQNGLKKRQGVPAEERPFYQNRCDDFSYCPYGSTCCLSLDGTYGCCSYIDATCCPDKVHCCPKNEACDATSEYCIGKYFNLPSKEKEASFAINDESLL